MDNPYVSGVLGAIVTAIVGIIVKLNHKRLRSKCCGRNVDVSVDIDDTTPPPKKIPKPIEIKVDNK
jgi:hypothetical protein